MMPLLHPSKKYLRPEICIQKDVVSIEFKAVLVLYHNLLDAQQREDEDVVYRAEADICLKDKNISKDLIWFLKSMNFS